MFFSFFAQIDVVRIDVHVDVTIRGEWEWIALTRSKRVWTMLQTSLRVFLFVLIFISSPLIFHSFLLSSS